MARISRFLYNLGWSEIDRVTEEPYQSRTIDSDSITTSVLQNPGHEGYFDSIVGPLVSLVLMYQELLRSSSSLTHNEFSSPPHEMNSE